MPTPRLFRWLLAAVAPLLVATPAWGHTHMLFPTPRTSDDGLKTGPCGNVAATGNPTWFAPGSTINVMWEETIEHPGHFRIAFSPAGDQGFDQNVLMDDIPDISGPAPHEYSQQVTLPDMTCDHCTLQVIQCMQDGVPTTSCQDYYACADIALGLAPDAGAALVDAGAGADGGPDAGTGGTTVGNPPGLCDVAAGRSPASSAPAALLALFALSIVLYRRRTHTHS